MPNDLKIRIHSDDPRLKRQINHDARSADYRLDTSGLSLVDVDWQLEIARLNQGSTGKCTAESACEVLGSQPFYSTLPTGIGVQLNDTWTDAFYSDEETLDGDGPYPPKDNGSSGLTSAKVAKNRGLISGYEHTFTAEDALKGLQLRPFAWGTAWKSGMDAVDTTTGQVKYTGTTRGGHELSGFKIDVLNERLWCNQHWGPWGFQLSGTFWISFDDFDKSLADQGDVTFYTPLNQPAPTPTPAPSSDAISLSFAAADKALLDGWAGKRTSSRSASAAWKRGTLATISEGDAARRGRHFQDAGSGRYVSEAFADANPTTTFGSQS